MDKSDVSNCNPLIVRLPNIRYSIKYFALLTISLIAFITSLGTDTRINFLLFLVFGNILPTASNGKNYKFNRIINGCTIIEKKIRAFDYK